MKLDGAYTIDLRPLPPEPERVLRAIAQVTAVIERSPQAIQVWVVSTRLLDAYSGDTRALMKLTEALFAATKRVEPMMMVETDAPEGVVYIAEPRLRGKPAGATADDGRLERSRERDRRREDPREAPSRCTRPHLMARSGPRSSYSARSSSRSIASSVGS